MLLFVKLRIQKKITKKEKESRSTSYKPNFEIRYTVNENKINKSASTPKLTAESIDNLKTPLELNFSVGLENGKSPVLLEATFRYCGDKKLHNLQTKKNELKRKRKRKAKAIVFKKVNKRGEEFTTQTSTDFQRSTTDLLKQLAHVTPSVEQNSLAKIAAKLANLEKIMKVEIKEKENIEVKTEIDQLEDLDTYNHLYDDQFEDKNSYLMVLNDLREDMGYNDSFRNSREFIQSQISKKQLILGLL